MTKAGRPKLQIDPEEVKKLAQLGATVKEIADFMGCSDATITNRFQEVVEEGRASLKISIRRAQLRLALEKDNCSMLIWLGKQLLGQTDVQTQNLTITEKKDNDDIVEGLIKKLGDK